MKEIHEIDSLEAYLSREHQLRDCVVQGLNLGEVSADWDRVKVEGAVFLGCRFPSLAFQERMREGGALIFPRLPRLPYKPYRPELYTRQELTAGWTPEKDLSVDKRIYDHYEAKGRHRTHVLEALAQRLHDHAIDDALHDLLDGRTDGDGPKKVVAIMGGHGTPRTDPFFEKVVRISRDLTRKGYFIASGGGPGMMEAANLGAWLANGEDELLDKSMEILSAAPVYTDKDYFATANEVINLHPEGAASVAIPTWFYGHEPSNLFSRWIAKYFSNSLREDGLLAIARYGVIYTPGSAGTTQEIFMDAAQNHYGTFDFVSPMVFLGRDRFETQTGLFSTLKNLAQGRQYADLLGISDDPEEVVELIERLSPVPYQTHT